MPFGVSAQPQIAVLTSVELGGSDTQGQFQLDGEHSVRWLIAVLTSDESGGSCTQGLKKEFQLDGEHSLRWEGTEGWMHTRLEMETEL